MSRFSDTRKRELLVLGPCECPGTPHEQDEAWIRTDLGSSALARIGMAEQMRGVMHDPLAGYRQLALEAIVSWNLLVLDDDGKAVEAALTSTAFAELNSETITKLGEEIDAAIERARLPNDSGVPSPASPRGNASRTPKPTPKRGT